MPRGGEWLDGHRLQQLQEFVHSARPGEKWRGAAADAYGRKNIYQARRLGQLASLDQQLGSHVTASSQAVLAGRQNLEEIRHWALSAAQSVPPGIHRDRVLASIALHGLTQVQRVVTASTSELRDIASKIRLLGDDYAALRGSEDGRAEKQDDETPIIQSVDFKHGTGDGDDTERRKNETAAFRELFGRDPMSAAEWTTAAALDPHTYDPDADGVPPEVRVARIVPVPGQGVVRVGQWIEQRDVISGPFKRDFGNIRAPDPQFDPANTKVTTYIDYENGLVVMRQNPSVELNTDGGPGQVKVGVPEAAIQQLPDGSVRIQYDAANPFAPDIAKNPPWPLQDNPWTVNGDLVFTPTQNGVHVDGTRTDYPSMEVYQDLPDGTTRTVLVDHAAAGNSTGPMVNLPQHHDIGEGGRAFTPFDTGAWNPDYDVRVALPWTEFGLIADPPRVPSPQTPGVEHV